MIDHIYTEEELRLISGHHTRDGMSAWLKSQGIPFIIAKSGWPRVHVKALERAMGVSVDDKIEIKTAAPFNFDALR